MKLVITNPMTRRQSNAIVETILEHVPFGLISSTWSEHTKKAYLWFWDESYVPEALKKFLTTPPGNEDKIKEMNKRIGDTLVAFSETG